MSDPVVQEIKDKLNIAEVIGEYLQLRRAGVNYKANCPFHNEKTPSFMVNPERNVWRCFGCNEGGDVFSFVQKYENLSFPDTLVLLADKAGVILPKNQYNHQESSNSEGTNKDKLLFINDLTSKFYHESLLRSSTGSLARDYLVGRGITKETIEKWKLGFAPDDWHQLEQFLLKRNISQKDALASGVLMKNETGKIYDRFRFRLMIPLHDLRGNVVGFTGRALSQDEPAKYLNSPETPIYNKSKTLFGYHFARKDIRDLDRVVLVEGNMDCISSHQVGVLNVVATSGTALTLDQLQILKKMCTTIVFAFDTDSAGGTATRRGLEMALSVGFDVRIANIGNAKDPDDLIKENPKSWSKAVENAQSFLDFSFSKIFDIMKGNNSESLRKGAYKHLDLVSLVTDPIIQAQEAQRVAAKLAVPTTSIVEYLKTKTKEKNNYYSSERAETVLPNVATVKDGRFLLEERVIALALINSEFADILKKYLHAEDFKELAMIAVNIITDTKSDSTMLPQLEFLGEEEYERIKQSVTDQNQIEKIYEGFCKSLKKFSLKDKMSYLSNQISQIEKTGDKEQFEKLKNEFNKTSEELTNL